MKFLIKNVFSHLGLVVQKKQPWMNNYSWLDEFNINTIIDVGANEGQFVNLIRTHLPNAQIWSFEPINEVFNQLKENTSKDELVHVFNYALGEENGFHEINVNNFSPSSSFLELEDVHIMNIAHTDISQIARKEKIIIKTLDSCLDWSDKPDNKLIKLDVQGFEDKVIMGGRETISNCALAIIETSFVPLYKGEQTFGYIYDLMKGLNFEYYGSLNSFKSNDNGRPIYCDALFINEKYF